MGLLDKAQNESSYSVASGVDKPYVVLQATLKEKLIGTGSGNLTELENVINRQAAKGYQARSKPSPKDCGDGRLTFVRILPIAGHGFYRLPLAKQYYAYYARTRRPACGRPSLWP